MTNLKTNCPIFLLNLLNYAVWKRDAVLVVGLRLYVTLKYGHKSAHYQYLMTILQILLVKAKNRHCQDASLVTYYCHDGAYHQDCRLLVAYL